MDATFLNSFLEAPAVGVPQTALPTDLVARVKTLEEKNSHLEARMVALEAVSGKLLQAFEKLVKEKASLVTPTLAPVQLSTLRPTFSHLPSWSASPLPVLVNPLSLGGFSSSPSPSMSSAPPSSQPLPAFVAVKVETPGMDAKKKEAVSSKDPATMSREAIKLVVSGKKFDASLESLINGVKKDLKPSDLEGSGPLAVARKLYTFAKGEIAEVVPAGEDAFTYGCRFIFAISDFMKNMKKGSDVEPLMLEGDDDDNEGLADTLALLPQDPVELKREAATENPAPKKKQKLAEWKELTFDDMNITPDVLGPDVLLDGAIKMGKSLSLSDSESLGLVIRLAELSDTGMHPFLKRAKVLYIKFAIIFQLKISCDEMSSRLLKVLVAVSLHNAVLNKTTDALEKLLSSMPGKTLDAKLSQLLICKDHKKTKAVIQELFQRATTIIDPHSAQAASPSALQRNLEEYLQAPTYSNPTEQILHVLMLSRMFLVGLQDLKPTADLLLGAVMKEKESKLLHQRCPDGGIAGFACAASLTF